MADEQRAPWTAAELVGLLGSQRHSLLNHLQVIAGWLQLGDGRRARNYLQALAGALEDQGRALAGLPPCLAAALAVAGVVAEAANVPLTLAGLPTAAGAGRDVTPAAARLIYDVAAAAVSALAGVEGARLAVEAHSHGGHLSVRVAAPAPTPTPAPPALPASAAADLAGRAAALGGRLVQQAEGAIALCLPWTAAGRVH